MTTLDHAVVRELKGLSDGDNPDFFWSQVALFSQRGRRLLEDMRLAVATGQYERLSSYAHALAGSAAVVGASHLSGALLALEKLAARGPMAADLALCLAAIGQEFQAAETCLFAEAGNKAG